MSKFGTPLKIDVSKILQPKQRNYSSLFLKKFADTDLEIHWNDISGITRPTLKMETIKIEKENSVEYLNGKPIWQPIVVKLCNSTSKFDRIIGTQIKRQIDTNIKVDEFDRIKFNLEYDDFTLTNCWFKEVEYEELDHSGQDSYIHLTISYEYATIKSEIDYLAATKEITNKYKHENQ